MNSAKPTLHPMSESNFKEILSIADSAFGKGYINRKELNYYLDEEGKSGIVAKINGEVAGFSLFRICTIQELTLLMMSDREWIDKQFVEKKQIGMINCVVVEQDYQKKGVATYLIDETLKKLVKVSNCLVSICWAHENKVGLGSILKGFGLSPVREIEHYWGNDSVLRRYNCKFCGEPPCKCKAVIYTK